MTKKSIRDLFVDGVLDYIQRNNLQLIPFTACKMWANLPESGEFGMWYLGCSTANAKKYVHNKVYQALNK